MFAERSALREKLEDMQLSQEERAVLAGSLQAVMHCLCSVVPPGNEAGPLPPSPCTPPLSHPMLSCFISHISLVGAPKENVFVYVCLRLHV